MWLILVHTFYSRSTFPSLQRKSRELSSGRTGQIAFNCSTLPNDSRAVPRTCQRHRAPIRSTSDKRSRWHSPISARDSAIDRWGTRQKASVIGLTEQLLAMKEAVSLRQLWLRLKVNRASIRTTRQICDITSSPWRVMMNAFICRASTKRSELQQQVAARWEASKEAEIIPAYTK